MKYTVVTGYTGSIMLTVEADNEEQACEKADDLIDEMSSGTLVRELGLDQAEQEAWVEA